MPIENGIIQAPFNTKTISQAIGKASLDVATLCMAGEPYINKWSKYKPIKMNTVVELTDSDFASSNFGLTIIENAYDSEIDALNNATTANWPYNPPDATNWKRLTDFNGYNKNAVIPYEFEISAVPGLDGYFPPSIHVFVGENPNADMSLSEFISLHNCGFGVLYKNNNFPSVQYSGFSFDDLSVQYPISGVFDANIPDMVGTVFVCIVIFKPNIGIINLPQAYNNIQLSNITTEQYIKINITPDVYLIEGNKNFIYTSMAIISNRNDTVELSYSYDIQTYANGILKDTTHFTGTKTIQPITTTQYLPIGDEISGNYGIWRDEGGYSNPTYKYVFSATTDKTGGITISKNGNI